MAKKSKKSKPAPKPTKEPKRPKASARGESTGSSPAPKASSGKEPTPKGKPGSAGSTRTGSGPSPAIAPAPKVVVVSGEDKETVLRLPSLLGTIYQRKAGAVSRRSNAHKERDDLHNQILELGHEARHKKHAKHQEYQDLRVKHGEVQDLIKALADEINGYECANDDIGRECAEGRLKFAEKSLEELLEEQKKGKPAPAEDGDQMTLDQTKPPGPNSSWNKIIAFKDFFGGKAVNLVRKHFETIQQLKWGVIPIDNPVTLAAWMNMEFRRIGNKDAAAATQDRAGIMPQAPEWFHDGLWALMAAAARGELCDGSEAHALEAENIVNSFRVCVEKDVEAWIKIVGRDSEVNKLVNTPAA